MARKKKKSLRWSIMLRVFGRHHRDGWRMQIHFDWVSFASDIHFVFGVFVANVLRRYDSRLAFLVQILYVADANLNKSIVH